MTTIREQIEAIRKYTEAIPPGDRRGIDRDNLARAVSALAILDAADSGSTWLNGECVEDLRIVLDPKAGRSDA